MASWRRHLCTQTEMHRPYTNVFATKVMHTTQTLRAYGHTRRPFEDPGTLAAQIEVESRSPAAQNWPSCVLHGLTGVLVTHPNGREVSLSPPALPPSPLQWPSHTRDRRRGATTYYVPPCAGDAGGMTPDDGGGSAPDDEDATMATARM